MNPDNSSKEADILDQAYARRSKKYQLSHYTDHTLHQNLLSKVFSIGMRKILALEERATKIMVYSTNLEYICDIHQQKKTKFEGKGNIFDLSYNPRDMIIGALSSNRRVLFWSSRPGYKFLYSHESKRLLTLVRFLEKNKLWAFATNDHFIELWTLTIRKEATFKMEQTFRAHEASITDILEITISDFLATSSLDGKIKIWDFEDFSLITELEDKAPGKSKIKVKGKSESGLNGIRGISYTSESGGNLLSSSFQVYINVWSPDSSLSKSFVGRLEGHSSIVLSCKVITSSPHCISIDERHNIRVWDLRTLTAVQMIRSEG